MNKKINLAVIFGGKSGEHEVSLSSARGVMKNLDKEKYNVIPIAITKGGNWLIGNKGAEYMKMNEDKIGKEGAISLDDSQKLVTIKDSEKSISNYTEGELKEKIDLVFPILHGPYGEDGRLQGMLDMLGMPYVFSGVLAHAIGMNKPKAKIIAAKFGVPIPEDIVINKGENYNLDDIMEKLSLPMMVKPSELGSSVGISLAKTKENLEKGIRDAFSHGDEVILEQYIKGREFTVTVMGNEDPKVLAVTEIIPLISEFYDYKAKYEDGGSKHVCPAEISKDDEEKLKSCAVSTFKSIGCNDLARIDFLWSEKTHEYYFTDINTIPGMTPTSLAPEAAKLAGMNFTELLDKLIEGAMKRTGM
ncbi:MAG: D-alanine--D-alanine ligase family protein [Candidatus Moranbacteria bacterium]|nr:D-alanine--D-alanine ligase family protein [Candidatus Moranbacteria bacterium]